MLDTFDLKYFFLSCFLDYLRLGRFSERENAFTMNNTQFRRLMLDANNTSTSNGNTTNATPRTPATMVSVLGSRMKSSIPMTP